MPLYSLEHIEKINSKALVITQQHKYSSKKPPLKFVIRLFKCFTMHLQFSICYIHFSRVCRYCLFLQLNDIQCMHKKPNEHFHLGDQKLSCGQFSLSLAFGHWHIKMMVPKLRFTAKPCTHQDIQGLSSLPCCISYIHTCRCLWQQEMCAVEGLQLY